MSLGKALALKVKSQLNKVAPSQSSDQLSHQQDIQSNFDIGSDKSKFKIRGVEGAIITSDLRTDVISQHSLQTDATFIPEKKNISPKKVIKTVKKKIPEKKNVSPKKVSKITTENIPENKNVSPKKFRKIVNENYARDAAINERLQMLVDKQNRFITNKSKKNMLKIMESDDGTFRYIQQDKSIQQTVSCLMVPMNHNIKMNWDLLILILAFYNCFEIPFEIAFNPPILHSFSIEFLNNLTDIFFCLDILVSFRTTYFDLDTGDEIFDGKLTAIEYLKKQFFVDLISTVPFDTIGAMITGQKNPILSLFSLLKLVRVTRLGKMIARLNVTQTVKNMLKLFQVVFFIIMYLHCSGCLWFVVASRDANWQPPLDFNNEDSDLYQQDVLYMYCTCIYYAVLTMTGNDIFPYGTAQIGFVALSIIAGALINANIFGSMAIIIGDLNSKAQQFQQTIDTANTAMKNMKLTSEIKIKVIQYLQYSYIPQEHQQEMQQFFDNISPSLREEVKIFIFASALEKSEFFSTNQQVKDFLIYKLVLQLSPPEEIKCSEGETSKDLFFIAKGECECYIRDLNKKERFVKILIAGDYFGEIALITGAKRTATIQTKNFSTIGQLKQDQFKEFCRIFPDMKNQLKQGLSQYQDEYKVWQKSKLQNVAYFKDLSFETLEHLNYKIELRDYEEGENIFKNGAQLENIYILVRGEIEIYVSTPLQDLVLENLKIEGCLLGQYTILDLKQTVRYSARTKTEVTMLELSKTNIVQSAELFKDLQQSIKNVKDHFIEQGFPTLDFQLERKLPKIGPLKDVTKLDLKKVFKSVVYKQMNYLKYLRKKKFKLSQLIAYIKENNAQKNHQNKEEQQKLIQSLTPIIKQRIQRMISSRVEKMISTVERQNFKVDKIVQILTKVHEAITYKINTDKKPKLTTINLHKIKTVKEQQLADQKRGIQDPTDYSKKRQMFASERLPAASNNCKTVSYAPGLKLGLLEIPLDGKTQDVAERDIDSERIQPAQVKKLTLAEKAKADYQRELILNAGFSMFANPAQEESKEVDQMLTNLMQTHMQQEMNSMTTDQEISGSLKVNQGPLKNQNNKKK